MLAGILSSIFAGGATGLVGMFLQRAFDSLFQYFKAKQDLAAQQEKNRHALAMKQVDLQITQAEAAGKERVAVVEGETAKETAATAAFAQTLLKEPERYSSSPLLTWGQNWVLVLLDFLRGIIRPALTIYLCALTSYIWWQVKEKLQLEDLDAKDVLQVWLLVVQTILYLTTTVVLWWFGTRNQQSAPRLTQYQPKSPPAVPAPKPRV